MNDDKKLLEMAAKAAGLKHDDEFNEIDGLPAFWIEEPQSHWWNPLTDDGDALRLAVKLGIDVQYSFKHVEAWRVGLDEIMEYHDDDPYAATRRAIVRAAAAIGEKL